MMTNHTMTLPAPADRDLASIHADSADTAEPLLRAALGEALRDIRSRNGMTLRQLSQAAAVSPGYLSELERGRKEVSSELLASVCHGLDISVADVLIEAAGGMALHSARPEMAAI